MRVRPINNRKELATLKVGTVLRNTPPAGVTHPGVLYFVVRDGGGHAYVHEAGCTEYSQEAVLRWAPLAVVYEPMVSEDDNA